MSCSLCHNPNCHNTNCSRPISFRMIFSIEEPSESERLNPDQLRELSGGDSIYGRQIQSFIEQQQRSDEQQQRSDEQQQRSDEQQRSNEQQQRSDEQQQRSDEQQQRSNEQQQRSDEQQQRSDEQQQRSNEYQIFVRLMNSIMNTQNEGESESEVSIHPDLKEMVESSIDKKDLEDKEDKEDKEDYLGKCIICLELKANCLALACKHLCMCIGCMNKLKKDNKNRIKCPMCRTKTTCSEIFVS